MRLGGVLGVGVFLLVRIKSSQVSTQDTVGLFALPEGVSFHFVSGCRSSFSLQICVLPRPTKIPALLRPALCAWFFLRVRFALVRLFLGVSGSVGRRLAVFLSFSALSFLFCLFLVFGAATLFYCPVRFCVDEGALVSFLLPPAA